MIAIRTEFRMENLRLPKSYGECTQIRNDMRRRLSWLRKKSDCGSSSSVSVRPKPEEARLWADGFEHLIASRYGLALFRAFLRREFSDENMEFYIAVEDYRNCRPAKMPQKAKKINSDFIAPQSPKEVNNIDIETRLQIAGKVNSQEKNLFDSAQKKVQVMLESDAYVRFIKSDLYGELLESDSSSDST